MQIQELVGVKKQLKDGKDMSFAIQSLIKHGFYKLGQGATGAVMAHDRLPYVLKLFDASDKAYLGFVRMALNSNSNPHFPFFRGKPVQLTPRTWAIRMEKLDDFHYNPASILDRGMGEIMAAQHLGPDWMSEFEDEHRAEEKRAVLTVLRKFPRMQEALDQMHKYEAANDFAHWDLHDLNVMKRRNVPVFSDPFAPGSA